MVETQTARRLEADFTRRRKGVKEQTHITEELKFGTGAVSDREKQMTMMMKKKKKKKGVISEKKLEEQQEIEGKKEEEEVQEFPEDEIEYKRTIVNRVKEQPRIESIIEKPFIEESHVVAVEEFRERPVYEIHETINEEIVYEESQREHHVLPTKYEEIGKEKQRLSQEDMEYVKGKKEPELLREQPEVRRLQQKPLIRAVREEERVEIHERPIVRQIRKQPVYKYYEQPVVRTVYEKPVLRIRREEGFSRDIGSQYPIAAAGGGGGGESASFVGERMHEAAGGKQEQQQMLESGQERQGVRFGKEEKRAESHPWYSFFDFVTLPYLIFLTTTWATLWFAAPIGVHLASQFRLFGPPVHRSLSDNRNILLFTTVLCVFGYIPGMLFALSYFSSRLLSDLFNLNWMRELYSVK